MFIQILPEILRYMMTHEGRLMLNILSGNPPENLIDKNKKQNMILYNDFMINVKTSTPCIHPFKTGIMAQ